MILGAVIGLFIALILTIITLYSVNAEAERLSKIYRQKATVKVDYLMMSLFIAIMTIMGGLVGYTIERLF